MSFWTETLLRLRTLFRRDRFEKEMNEEIRFHLAAQIELNRASGMSEKDAEASALRQFGHLGSIQENCRDLRSWFWLESLRRDIRFALRILGKSPGFTAVIIFTLALGIGVNGTIFQMLNGMFLEDLPLPDSNRLVVVAEMPTSAPIARPISYLDFKDLAAHSKSLIDWTASFPTPVQVGWTGQSAERIWAQVLSPDAFEKLHLTPALGRGLVKSDGDALGSSSAVVISDRYWKRAYHADPAVIGRKMTVNGHPFTVVGVMRPGFRGLSWSMNFDVFFPAGAVSLLYNDSGVLLNRGTTTWRIMARLAPNVSMDAARAELSGNFAQLKHDFPEEHKDVSLGLYTERRSRPDVTFAAFTPLIFLLGVGMMLIVLGIACANVANVLLSRIATRQKELLMRSALGANRAQLIRQMLVENVLMALLAGVVGYFLAICSGSAFTQFRPSSDLPVYIPPLAVGRTIGFTFGLSLLVGVGTGLLPAWRATRLDLAAALNGSANSRITGEKHRLRNFLVVLQVAASFVALVSTSCFLRALQAAELLPLGFNAKNLVLVSCDLKLQGYRPEQISTFAQELARQSRSLSDIENLSVTTNVPFDYTTYSTRVFSDGAFSLDLMHGVDVNYSCILPNYFATMAVAIRQGRDFNDDDNAGHPLVAIVNRAFAEKFWPSADPIGRTIKRAADGPSIRIVGVTDNGRYQMISETQRPYVYFPMLQAPTAPFTVVARVRGSDQLAFKELNSVIRSLDSGVPTYGVKTMDELLNRSVFAFMPVRMGALMAGIQGTVAVLLAVLGLYALVSYSVNQRVREIGIRVALGARVQQVLVLVTKNALRVTLVGSLVGAAISTFIVYGFSRFLYGVNGWDWAIFLSTIGLLTFITFVACYIPARSALSIDPNEALRRD